MRKISAFLFALLAVGSLAIYLTAAAHKTGGVGSQATEIASPSGWVPFHAEVEKTRARSSVRMVGRYYRDRDGSSRSELGIAGGDWTHITIMNVPQNTYYERSKSGEWCSHPMGISSRGWQPHRMRLENANLDGFAGSVEGLSVRRLLSRNGSQLVAPDLNFFALVNEDATVGLHERYFNIVVGDPEPSLFEPPTGSLVAAHTQVLGIVNDGRPAPSIKDLRPHR